MDHVLKLLAIIVPVFLLGYFLEETIDGSGSLIPGSVEETLEILSELFSVFVAFSIFSITWQAYNKSRDRHSLFLGAAFFIVGILILFHLLSYPFMPEFITANSPQKAAIFLIASRMILAIFLLASVYIHKDTSPGLINRRTMISFAIFISAIFLASILMYVEDISPAYDLDSYSTATLFLLFVITIIILTASYLYAKRIEETGQNNLIYLIYGAIIIVFSNLVYFSYEFSGHFLIITGFFFIYLALYKSSVESPYEKLALAEEKLRRAAEDRYRNLFENANDGIITMDIEDRVTSWNRGAEKIFGWASNEVMGKILNDIIVPRDQETKREEIIHDTLAGKSISGIETLRMRRDGSKVNVSLTKSPILDTNLKTVGISLIIRDITERKRAEEEHKKAEEIHQENINLTLIGKAKSEFLLTMSHELRTPLNSIIGFSTLMKQKENGELNQKQEHYMDNVLTSGRHLLSLIDGILDISRIEAGKMELDIEKVSISETITETLTLIKEKAAKKNVILKKEFDNELEFIEVDRAKFKQILFNLLSNAVKFSKPEGGTVTITSKKEGDMAEFSVSDTGIGIRGEDMGRLFRTFEQIDSGGSRVYGGTGLGLAISKKLIDLHGGKITVESKYGEGTTFTFVLPIWAKKINSEK